jgi:hypothetical protein
MNGNGVTEPAGLLDITHDLAGVTEDEVGLHVQ